MGSLGVWLIQRSERIVWDHWGLCLIEKWEHCMGSLECMVNTEKWEHCSGSLGSMVNTEKWYLYILIRSRTLSSGRSFCEHNTLFV